MNDMTPVAARAQEQAASPLFTAVPLGRYTLPNRIVMAPMTRDRTPGQVPNALNAEYYAQRATAGLIVTEGVAPHPMGLGYIDIPGLYTDEQALGWREVSRAVRQAAREQGAEGGRIFAQLMYVGRVSHPDFLDGRTPFGPSAIRPEGATFTVDGPKPFVEPRAMTEADIEEALESYAHAAGLAVGPAELDGVEIHGANGYLPSQFLAPNANQRTDAWGGDVPRRARFLLEAVDRAAAAIGPDRVGVRLSPGGTFNDIHDTDWPATYAYVLPELDRRGLAYIHVVAPQAAPGPNPDSAGPSVAALARSQVRQTPLMLNGGYDRERAEADLWEKRADLVSFGVPFLANPDLPRRMAENAALNAPDPSTFYAGGPKGYVDYPRLDEPASRVA
ncbi:MAG TPA: alkene reductase [Mesorhizobium sp.]|jgi:N-ethylmaleimide reductase|nr:alkene reductase [Mesorhizobium sp.]